MVWINGDVVDVEANVRKGQKQSEERKISWPRIRASTIARIELVCIIDATRLPRNEGPNRSHAPLVISFRRRGELHRLLILLIDCPNRNAPAGQSFSETLFPVRRSGRHCSEKEKFSKGLDF